MVACYLSLTGEEGMSVIKELFLNNKEADYTQTYSAIMALRFHAAKTEVLTREQILDGLSCLLDREDLADLIIPDLARMEDWKALPKLMELFRTAKPESFVRVPIINFVRVCPLAEADEALEVLNEIDPVAVKRASTLFPFPNLSLKHKVVKTTDTDDEYRQQLDRIQQLRVDRKPTIDEVNEVVSELMDDYPKRSSAIHWEAAHVLGQSGIKKFADEIRRHATGALTAEDDPVRRAWMYMYLSNLEEVQGQTSKATHGALKGLLELQPFNLPDVAPEPPAVGRFRGLLNPGDENYESNYELFQRLTGTEQEMRDAAVRTRELVRFRGIFINILKRLNKNEEDRERLQEQAREVGGHEWLDDLVKTLAK